MILVTLGTQDKSFVRLLKEIDRLIDKGIIKEKVIVQGGYTEYESKNMEVFSLVSKEQIEEYVNECSLLITHGGVGSIVSALKRNKKVIAVARLSKYNEHTNDHQLQIVNEFEKLGYIINGTDIDKLEEAISKVKTFKPNKYQSNNSNMIELVTNYIDNNGRDKMFGRYREVIMYVIFGVLTTLINIVSFYLIDKFGVNVYINNTISWLLSVIFAFVTNKIFVFESMDVKRDTLVKEGFTFISFRILSYFIDMLTMFTMINILSINKMFSKVVANVIVIVINYVFSKLFVFKKKGV